MTWTKRVGVPSGRTAARTACAADSAQPVGLNTTTAMGRVVFFWYSLYRP